MFAICQFNFWHAFMFQQGSNCLPEVPSYFVTANSNQTVLTEYVIAPTSTFTVSDISSGEVYLVTVVPSNTLGLGSATSTIITKSQLAQCKFHCDNYKFDTLVVIELHLRCVAYVPKCRAILNSLNPYIQSTTKPLDTCLEVGLKILKNRRDFHKLMFFTPL